MTDDVHSRITSQTTMELNPTKNDRFFEVSGNGTLFVNSIGSIIRRELKKGEQWTVRPDHFVASNCRLIQQSIISAKSIYIFEGPGILILQVSTEFPSSDNFYLIYSRVRVELLYRNGSRIINKRTNFFFFLTLIFLFFQINVKRISKIQTMLLSFRGDSSYIG